MAASTISAASAGGRKRGRRRAVMSEINVTPFVDVMLVLLIVFMVSAPLLTVGVPIDLPQSQAKALDQDNEPLTLSVNVGGTVFLQNERDQARRSGAEAQGDHRGPRRQCRRADLCAWRQEGRLRYDDACDGADFGGRLPPGGACHRGRAGRAMKPGMTISCIGHAVALVCGLVAISAQPIECAAGRRRCRCPSFPRRTSRR